MKLQNHLNFYFISCLILINNLNIANHSKFTYLNIVTGFSIFKTTFKITNCVIENYVEVANQNKRSVFVLIDIVDTVLLYVKYNEGTGLEEIYYTVKLQ